MTLVLSRSWQPGWMLAAQNIWGCNRPNMVGSKIKWLKVEIFISYFYFSISLLRLWRPYGWINHMVDHGVINDSNYDSYSISHDVDESFGCLHVNIKVEESDRRWLNLTDRFLSAGTRDDSDLIYPFPSHDHDWISTIWVRLYEQYNMIFSWTYGRSILSDIMNIRAFYYKSVISL